MNWGFMPAQYATDAKEENCMSMNYRDVTAQPEYDIQFWNSMKGMGATREVVDRGRIAETGSYNLPVSASKKMEQEIKRKSVFRNIATVLNAKKTAYRIYTKDCKDLAQFVPETGEIPIYDGVKDFNEKSVDRHKLAVFIKMDEDFVSDAAFSVEDYLITRLGRNFSRAEDNGFINGNGESEPTGILHSTKGAEVGVTTEKLSYDDVISLYFSLDKEYRSDGVWMMNDKTALTLRKLKDADGNYLWNNSDNTILNKEVIISEFMPDISEGEKPIAFGDFSYYWIIDRKSISVRSLKEKFAALSQIGYLAFEFLDGKLIRNEAVKVIQIGK